MVIVILTYLLDGYMLMLIHAYAYFSVHKVNRPIPVECQLKCE